MTARLAAIGKLTIVVIAIGVLFGGSAGLQTRAQATPMVWTGKADYEPNELVDINGRDFLPNALYRVLVTWPDGSARVAGNNGVVLCSDPTVADGTVCYHEVLTGADGSFRLLYQLLNGQRGPYQIYVYDQAAAVVATGSFTDDASGPAPTGSHSHLVRNANESPGQAQPPVATGYESQRTVFKNPRGMRHTYALVVFSNNEGAAGLAGGLWLLRSTDNGATWTALERLKRDNNNPPRVSGSLWTHDDGTKLVAYVTYGEGSNDPVLYRQIRIMDDGTYTVGLERIVVAAVSHNAGSIRPVTVRDRNGRVHIAYRHSNSTMRIIGTVSPDPDDMPTWSAAADVITSPANLSNHLPALVPFGGIGNLLGYVAIGRTSGAAARNTLFGRNVVDFNGVSYTYGSASASGVNLGAIARNDTPADHLPLSIVAAADNVAHMLYVKSCIDADCPESAAGAGVGVFARKASAANTVESWGAAVQVSPDVAATASLSLETGVAPNRLYAFFGRNTGVVSFRSSASDVIAWGAAGCAGTGGTVVSGTRCDITTSAVETNVDWLSSSVNGPIQVLWTRQVANSPVRHYYLDSAPPSSIDFAFAPDGTPPWHKTSPAVGSVTAKDDAKIESIICTDSLGKLTQGDLAGGGTATASRTLTVSDEGTHTISCTATDGSGNTATATEVVRIDATPPTILGSRTPPAIDNTWNGTDVTVSFTCEDLTSGPAAGSPPPPTVLSAEGAGQSVTGTCTDQAGHSASATVGGINIDKTAPEIALLARTPHNERGWNNSDVVVEWTCIDETSGPVADTVSKTVEDEGEDLSATGTCQDLAGHSASHTVDGINIDKRAPTIAGSRTPPANEHSWNNSPVTVSFTCEDERSGLAADSPPEPTTLSDDGAGQSVTGTCTDLAGNSAEATVAGINIDQVRPTAIATPDPGPNDQGWNRESVTVSFSGADEGGSGIHECTGPVTLEEETPAAGTEVSGTCTDLAGNESDPAVQIVRIDMTPPDLAYELTPGANEAGWNNTPVVLSFICTDALSGVLSDSGSAEHSTEGQFEVEGVCTDNAGNDATPLGVTVRIDMTEPTIVATRTPDRNDYGWNNSDVTVSFACEDALSGLAAGSPPAATEVSGEGAGQSVTGTCTDLAENPASATVDGINIDKTAPEIKYVGRTPANDHMWNNADVTVDWTCTDALSDVVKPAVSQTVRDEGADQSATGTCQDRAGNPASDTQTGINIDKTAPTLAPAVSPDPVVLNGSAEASSGAADALSGIDTESCGALHLDTVGTKTLTCSASDKAGNPATKERSYKVQYASSGMCLGSPGHAIMQPINMNGTSVFKKGSTVPAKFRVCDAKAVSIGGPGVVASFYRINGIPGTLDAINEDVVSTTPDTAFRWSASDQLWIFNISTKDAALRANSTYVYWITLNDDTIIEFRFGLK